MSDLLKNVERAMYSFNFNNIVEICFDKTINFSTEENKINSKLSIEEKVLFDNCIDKYMSAFNIVKDTSLNHIEKLVNRNST